MGFSLKTRRPIATGVPDETWVQTTKPLGCAPPRRRSGRGWKDSWSAVPSNRGAGGNSTPRPPPARAQAGRLGASCHCGPDQLGFQRSTARVAGGLGGTAGCPQCHPPTRAAMGVSQTLAPTLTHLRLRLLFSTASHRRTSWCPSSAVAKSTWVFRPDAMCS